MLSNTPQGFGEPRNRTPVVSLIASLNHLEQFDFFTSDDFTTGLMEAFSRHHPHCRLNIFGKQEVGPSSLYPNTKAVSRCNSDFNMEALQLPGLHTLTTALSIVYQRWDCWTSLPLQPDMGLSGCLKALLTTK
jgi:hypothetical protein